MHGASTPKGPSAYLPSPPHPLSRQPGMYKYVIKGVYTAGSWLIWLIV